MSMSWCLHIGKCGRTKGSYQWWWTCQMQHDFFDHANKGLYFDVIQREAFTPIAVYHMATTLQCQVLWQCVFPIDETMNPLIYVQMKNSHLSWARCLFTIPYDWLKVVRLCNWYSLAPNIITTAPCDGFMGCLHSMPISTWLERSVTLMTAWTINIIFMLTVLL